MPKRLLAFVFLVFPFVTSAQAAAPPLKKEMAAVSRIRGLEFLHPVKTKSVLRADLPQILRAEMMKSTPYSADDYALILRSLRLVDEEVEDPVGKMITLLQGQVLAFYDPLSHTYYSLDSLPDAAKPLGNAELLESSVVLHELTHALQDQHFDAGTRDYAMRNDWDASLAYHSLMEGDASLVMMASVIEGMGASFDDMVKNDSMLSMLTSAAAADKTIEAGAPRYFVESLKFPYIDGLKFVITAYRRGGWKAVDAIYADPPRSTREVLHPDEYFARAGGPVAPRVPFTGAPPLAVPQLLTVEHLGEFHWAFLVGPEAARGWANDRVTIAQDERCDPTVLVETTWESAARARAFRDAYAAKMPEARVVQNGTSVRAAYGADLALIERYLP
ncbi:MAG TPA: hypothetical protein VGR02_20865 [Thermoanaerobaculia bacterium]|nr:hypothetical protein [Thermoanaerobaculia bacterium]